MAKRKQGQRGFITLECSACAERNYRTSKKLAGGLAKLDLTKYCSRCKKHVAHKERKK